MTRRASLLLSLALTQACLPGFSEVPEPVCVKTVLADVNVPTQQAADVLIVVDNSGSMLEEQQNLAANFLNQDPVACPLQDLTNIPPEFKNPRTELYKGDGPLAQCGLIQIVAAFDNDFRIGVITTDVGLCDNRLPGEGPAGWGNRPQRGCLQPDSAPGGTLRKVIARADLLDADPANDDLAARFGATLANIGTVGTPFERGLDAANLFLDPAAADRHPDCTSDLANFRREGASLVTIFLTDENDCSHALDDGLTAFGNELDGEVCGQFLGHYVIPSSRCYTNPDALPPVSSYVDALLAKEPELKVAVIAGAIGADDTPSGCIVGADGAPTDACVSAGGLSTSTDPGELCGDTPVNPTGDPFYQAIIDGRQCDGTTCAVPCCVADAGDRYYELADALGRRETDSICNASFRDTMLDIAAFIAAVDSVLLAEPPNSPEAVIVELVRVNDDPISLPQLDEDDDCANVTGYRIEGDRILLCGDARPGPGDELRVRARASADSETCDDPVFEASGGGANCASTQNGAWLALVALVMVRLRRGRAT
jgi:hypothetical protein